jgi:hypothetical protein
MVCRETFSPDWVLASNAACKAGANAIPLLPVGRTDVVGLADAPDAEVEQRGRELVAGDAAQRAELLLD